MADGFLGGILAGEEEKPEVEARGGARAARHAGIRVDAVPSWVAARWHKKGSISAARGFDKEGASACKAK